MIRCNFCYDESFNNLDEVYTHQVVITSEGKSICPKLREWESVIDSSGADELIPSRVVGFKYAPKDHDGMFVFYNSKGELVKDPKKIGVNRLHKLMFHGESPTIRHVWDPNYIISKEFDMIFAWLDHYSKEFNESPHLNINRCLHHLKKILPNEYT